MRWRSATKVVAVANHHRLHATLLVDQGGEFARDGKRYVFLPCAGASDCARVLTTMAGVDRDHDVALPPAFRLH
jgi:hypothetical protein